MSLKRERKRRLGAYWIEEMQAMKYYCDRRGRRTAMLGDGCLPMVPRR